MSSKLGISKKAHSRRPVKKEESPREEKHEAETLELDSMAPERKVLSNIISGATNLTEISNILCRPGFDLRLLLYCKTELTKKLRSYTWPSDLMEDDLISIYNMALSYDSLIDLDVISLVFRSTDFNVNICTSTLNLLNHILIMKKFSNSRDEMGALRSAITYWIRKQIPLRPAEEKQPWIETLIDIIKWWNETLKTLSTDESMKEYQRTVAWILRVYLETTCQQNSMKSIQSIYTVSKLDIPFKLFYTTFGDVILSLTNQLKTSQVFDSIFHFENKEQYEEQEKEDEDEDKKEDKQKKKEREKLKYETGKRLHLKEEEQYELSPWVRRLVRDIVLQCLDKLNETPKKQTLLELAEEGEEVTLPMLLRSCSVTWPIFLVWHRNQTSVREHFEATEGNRPLWRKLDYYSSFASEIFLNSYNLFTSSQCNVELVSLCMANYPKQLESAWAVLSCPEAASIINTHAEGIQSMRNLLDQIIIVSEKFLPKSKILENALIYQKKWQELTVNQIRHFLRFDEQKQSLPFDTIPIPREFLNALDWLKDLLSIRLFKFVWDEQNIESPVEQLIEASKSWRTLYEEIKGKKIKFSRLEDVAHLLVDPVETQALIRTAKGIEYTDQYTWKITVLEKDETNWLKAFVRAIRKWLHLLSVYQSINSIRQCLTYFHIFIEPSGLQSLQSVQEFVASLHTLFKELHWPNLILNDYPKFSHSEKIDPCLVNLSPKLFETISKSLDLLGWLRGMPNDNDFTSSIEMAMGKSEMECPIELWKEEPGRPGRPDEQKLSMLNTVRSYLHGIIYYPTERFDDLPSLLEVLRQLGASDANTIDCILTCNEYRLSLMELLSDQTDDAAPDKLLQLLQPNRNATWICSNESPKKEDKKISQDSEEGRLWLEWNVPRKDQVLKQQQNINELQDFQCTVVLARTDHRTQETQKAIDTFIQQFGWMRRFNDVLLQLYEAGHFDYRNYRYQFSLSTDPEIIHSEVIRTEKILAEWKKQVNSIRKEFYYLNFYGMKQLWKLVDFMDSSTQNKDVLQNILLCYNPDLGYNPNVVKSFSEEMISSWKIPPKDTERSAVDTLRACSEALQVSLAPLPVRRRKLSTEEISKFPKGDDISSGIHLVCTDEPQKVMDVVISSFVREGNAPEREFVYICRDNTSWEEVYNLILRWKNSHKYGRNNCLYCLGSVEELSFELQRSTILALGEASSQSENPLLIVSGSSDNQHIVAQLGHRRVSLTPLPVNILCNVSKNLAQNYSLGIKAYTGSHAGSGKTFQILSMSQKSSSTYLHFPVMSSKFFLKQLQTGLSNNNNKKEKILLHIDLMDTVQKDFGPIIFEMAYLGGVVDNKGELFIWDPKLTFIAFEVAYGPVILRLRICTLLDQNPVEVNANTFCSSKVLLKNGMLDFESSRYDGTSLRKEFEANSLRRSAGWAKSSSSVYSNAYQRLHYVCIALDTLEKNHDRFPYVFETSTMTPLQSLRLSRSKEELSGERCFNLLIKYSKLDLARTSLWCLWNFINVFYWQLRDLHHPESPVNNACLPDAKSGKDNEQLLKEKIKGEVIHFLIRTAREFATRQTKETDPERIFAINVSEMSRWEFCGVWLREPYDNDNQPVFKKDAYYMYYRGKEDQWVIDDVIEPTGATYSQTSGADLTQGWATSPGWRDSNTFVVRQTSNRLAHKGISYTVTGGGQESGEYLQQPPYDDIAGHPHYIMQQPRRRHLFWSDKEQVWQICPVCNNDEGAFALSKTSSIIGKWMYMPSDEKETKATFKYIYEKDRSIQSYSDYKWYIKTKVENTNKIEEVDFVTDGLQELWDNTVKWNDSNHECLLFSNESHVVSFLSLDPKKMRESMHPGLLSYLEQNQINVGEDLDKLSKRHHHVLSALTEVSRSAQEEKKLLGGKYCLTGDSLLKMLAIMVRIRCGVPVVLMGECGCGKTMLIRYLCAWLGVSLLVLDVHGGTSEFDIMDIFEKAKNLLKKKKTKEVYVFLDEVNTCAHMGLICEAMCHRSLYGQRLPDGIKILGALNPYRRRQETEQTPGLVFQLHGTGTIPDPMSKLVYRVHPIPNTLRDFIFDFGSLTPDKEQLYIRSMVDSKFKSENNIVHIFITGMVLQSQIFIRNIENDPSATSLRDVRRCLDLIGWFSDNIITSSKGKTETSEKKSKNPLPPLAASLVLGLAFVYYFRISSSSQREAYWRSLQNSDEIPWHNRELRSYKRLSERGAFEKLLQMIQKKFCSNVQVEDGIAMNEALTENLFVTIICMLNRIPVFIVGKPGSSKTLTMQVIASNLQGKQSAIEFWKKFPAVYIFQYQCSPMSDSHSIQHQFDMAVRYQQHARDSVTVLLLDEVGLAEHSPEMPLKVLHGMLVDPPVAIVGLSNWVLDPAKMNRAICLHRTEPSKDDIKLTGKHILESSSLTEKGNKIKEQLTPILSPLAKAYHKVYTGQKGRDFIGMRDYYNLVKFLRNELLLRGESGVLDKDLLTMALCRNFGGKPELMEKILNTFHKYCFKSEASKSTPSITNLIKANLSDKSARHIMVLTKNGTALPLMFACGILNKKDTKVLIGSEFKDDMSELYLVKQINEVKLAMASGSTIVLLNHDNIYEALYDVLNQRYLFKNDATTGQKKKMLRLAIGSRTQLCRVLDGFKVVVVVEQDYAYSHLDLPLLNRFEKQVLCAKDILGINQCKVVEILRDWIGDILNETGFDSFQDLFCGFHEGTIASAVLNLTNYDDSNVDEKIIIPIIKKWLAHISFPVAAMQSKKLLEESGVDYFQEHTDFVNVINKYILSNCDILGKFSVLVTYSPVSHLNISFEGKETIKCKQNTLQLSELSSERQFINLVADFFKDPSKDPSLLIIQCDPIVCRQSLINHAQHICFQQYTLYQFELEQKKLLGENSDENPRYILFLVHLPPTVGNRKRDFILDFHPPWSYMFIDDIRPEIENILRTTTMLQKSIFQLISEGSISLKTNINSQFQSALSCCMVPEVGEESSYFFRIQLLKKLQKIPKFEKTVENLILKIFEFHQTPDSKGMHKQVGMVYKQLVGGSLRQSLDVAIQTIFLQALVSVIQILDKNFNLSILGNQNPLTEELWFSLLEIPTVLDKNTIGMTSVIGGNSCQLPIVNIENTGRAKPFACRFPFSYVLIRELNAPETRNIIQFSNTSGSETVDPQYKLEQICRGIFGDNVIQLWSKWGEGEQLNYLHDFVAQATPLFPGLNFDLKLLIYEKIVRITRADAITSPAGIHTACWMNETRLFHFCMLMGTTVLSSFVRNQLIKTLKEFPIAAKSDKNSAEDSLLRAAHLDAHILYSLTSKLWEDLKRYSSRRSTSRRDIEVSTWLETIATITSDVEAVFLSLAAFPKLEVNKKITLEKIQRLWLRLMVARIFLQEVWFQAQDFIKDVIKNIGKCAVYSQEYFISLIQSISLTLTNEKNLRQNSVSAFVRRYVQEIVFGEQEGFINCNLGIPKIEPGLVQTLITLINEIPPKSKKGNKEDTLNLFLTDLPMRRVLLSCLVKAINSGISGPLGSDKRKDFILTSVGAQLYLQHVMDILVDTPKKPDLTQNDVKSLIDKKTEMEKHIQAICLSQFHLREYAKFISGSQITSAEAGLYLTEQLKEFLCHETSFFPRVLLLQMILNHGGIDSIMNLIYFSEKDVPWLIIRRDLLKEKKNRSLPDPWNIVGDKKAYDDTCTAVRITVSRNSSDTTPLNSILKKDLNYLPLILAAFFSQTVGVNAFNTQGLEAAREKLIAYGTNVQHQHLFEWVAKGCPISPKFDANSQKSQLQLQVILHCLIWAIKCKYSWLYNLAFDPKTQQNSYIPSIPDDFLSQLAKLLEGGRLGWYKCPNGHPYSVGECTMPMQTGRCIQCGVQIGGQNHVSVKGITRIGNEEVSKSLSGYSLESSSTDCHRLTNLNTRMLRLIVHGVMLFGLNSLGQQGRNDMAKLALNRNTAQVNQAIFTIYERFEEDWEKLIYLTNLSEVDMTIGIHILLQQCWSFFSREEKENFRLHQLQQYQFRTADRRNSFERDFSVILEKIFGRSDTRKIVQDARGKFEQSGQTTELQRALGDSMWLRIHEQPVGEVVLVETSLNNLKDPINAHLLWRFREPVSFEHFVRMFQSRSENAKKFSLLAEFLDQEEHLSIIKYMADILSWHSVLFEAFGNNSLTREEASDISNRQAIERLPEHKQKEAHEVFERFCEGFQKAFPKIPRLYECQANPFLTKEGNIDLSGTQKENVQMDGNTSVIFSLPSMANGENDARGLCTIQLLNLMQTTHSQLLEKLLQPVKENAGKTIGDQPEITAARREPEEIKIELPPVSHLTPYQCIKRQLIVYNRNTHLLPLLRTFAIQSLDAGQGSKLDYDFRQIEESLANGLLAGKMPINLVSCHFGYRGEVQQRSLSSLRARIPQETLPVSIQEAIWAEIDTQNHLAQLMAQLEVCINFLVSIGSTNVKGIDGNMSLQKYIVEILLVDPKKWDECSSPTISQQLRLCHLQSLFMILEEKMHGSPLDDISPTYREPLDPEMDDLIRETAVHLDIDLLLPLMRDFMVAQLVRDNWPAKANLKEYLTYAGGDVDLEDLPWYENFFPPNIQLRNCLAVFHLLTELRPNN